MHRVLHVPDRRGMRASARGMRPMPESTERRGMDANPRSMRPMRESSERRGMGRAAQLTVPEATFVACPPNGLAFSCRERAGKSLMHQLMARRFCAGTFG